MALIRPVPFSCCLSSNRPMAGGGGGGGWSAPCVTFRLVVVSLRGPGQSSVLPFACCVGSLLSVSRCGRCSCWCRFRVRGAVGVPPHSLPDAELLSGTPGPGLPRTKKNPHKPKPSLKQHSALISVIIGHHWGGEQWPPIAAQRVYIGCRIARHVRLRGSCAHARASACSDRVLWWSCGTPRDCFQAASVAGVSSARWCRQHLDKKRSKRVIESHTRDAKLQQRRLLPAYILMLPCGSNTWRERGWA